MDGLDAGYSCATPSSAVNAHRKSVARGRRFSVADERACPPLLDAVSTAALGILHVRHRMRIRLVLERENLRPTRLLLSFVSCADAWAHRACGIGNNRRELF